MIEVIKAIAMLCSVGVGGSTHTAGGVREVQEAEAGCHKYYATCVGDLSTSVSELAVTKRLLQCVQARK